jgi:N-acetylmuramoyl-L-alanine amidase
MRKIDSIIVHCSDSPDSRNIGVAEITKWHQERGFRTCGYHKVIRRDGTIERGRPDREIGAHCVGHNRGSLGICWVGRDTPGDEQYGMLVETIKNWCIDYGIPAERVVGHREAAPMSGKTCPNLDMGRLRAWVRKRIAEDKTDA